MWNYRRCYVPGGSYFFTVVTKRRTLILGNDVARAAFWDCMQRWPPFRVDALVMLRDHLHGIWTLPPGDADYSKRWGAIKKHFTQRGKAHIVGRNSDSVLRRMIEPRIQRLFTIYR
jgi:putative transposase